MIKRSILILVTISIIFCCFLAYRNNKTKRVIRSTINSEFWNECYNGFKSQPAKKDAIIFLGNSLTQGFKLSVFNDTNILNRGISGDFTEGILKRLNEVTERKPKKIFLMIGINDIIEKVPLKTSMINYEKIIRQIRNETPTTALYIQSILPVIFKTKEEAKNMQDPRYIETLLTSNENLNSRARLYNEQLVMLAGKYHLPFIDLYPYFTLSGSLNKELTYDGVHLNEKGYSIWKKKVEKFVRE